MESVREKYAQNSAPRRIADEAAEVEGVAGSVGLVSLGQRGELKASATLLERRQGPSTPDMKETWDNEDLIHFMSQSLPSAPVVQAAEQTSSGVLESQQDSVSTRP